MSLLKQAAMQAEPKNVLVNTSVSKKSYFNQTSESVDSKSSKASKFGKKKSPRV